MIEGNRAWKAAAEVRRRWLAGSLLIRRTAPREAVQFAACQLLAMPDPCALAFPTLRAGRRSASSPARPAKHYWTAAPLARLAGSRC